MKRLSVGDLVIVVDDRHFSKPHYVKEFQSSISEKPGYIVRLFQGKSGTPRAYVLWKLRKPDAEGISIKNLMANLPLGALMAIE